MKDYAVMKYKSYRFEQMQFNLESIIEPTMCPVDDEQLLYVVQNYSQPGLGTQSGCSPTGNAALLSKLVQPERGANTARSFHVCAVKYP